MNKDTLRAAVETSIGQHISKNDIISDYDGMVEKIVAAVLSLLPKIDNEAAFDMLLSDQDFPSICEHEFDCISFEVSGRNSVYQCRHCQMERRNA